MNEVVNALKIDDQTYVAEDCNASIPCVIQRRLALQNLHGARFHNLDR